MLPPTHTPCSHTMASVSSVQILEICSTAWPTQAHACCSWLLRPGQTYLCLSLHCPAPCPSAYLSHGFPLGTVGQKWNNGHCREQSSDLRLPSLLRKARLTEYPQAQPLGQAASASPAVLPSSPDASMTKLKSCLLHGSASLGCG